MKLNCKQQAMLDGKHGKAARKAMEILAALGTIYAAERMLPVTSVQVSGVSYENLGEAGLAFLSEMAENGGKAQFEIHRQENSAFYLHQPFSYTLHRKYSRFLPPPI